MIKLQEDPEGLPDLWGLNSGLKKQTDRCSPRGLFAFIPPGLPWCKAVDCFRFSGSR